MKSSLTISRKIVVMGTLFACCLFEPEYSLLAQKSEQPVQFNFAVECNRFRYSDSLAYFEFSASFYRDMIKYVPDGDTYRGEFLVTAEIIKDDSVHARKQWKNINSADSLGDITNSQLLYCLNYCVLRKGSYTFRIKIEDPNSSRHNTVEYPFEIEDYRGSDLQLSDIQFATSIQRDTSKDIYVKNGYRINPNPSALYGIGLPILYSYAEVYNLASATSDSGAKYLVSYKIFDSDGQVVKSVAEKARTKPGASSVEVNGVNVVVLVSGAYTLVLEVADAETGQKATAKRRFWVYREGDYAEGGAKFAKREKVAAAGSPGLDADRYDIMTEKELDQEFEWARYISNKEERDTYKKLPTEGKRQYLKEFWGKRDQSPGTPENEFKRDYLSRVNAANLSFKGTFREGWRTDRGRTLLVYGKPDETERFPFSSEQRAYEVWHFFSIQGGVDFIFVDKREMGDYELVHSTARGELYDAAWQRWLNPNK